jgi:hypothetical protein
MQVSTMSADYNLTNNDFGILKNGVEKQNKLLKRMIYYAFSLGLRKTRNISTPWIIQSTGLFRDPEIAA